MAHSPSPGPPGFANTLLRRPSTTSPLPTNNNAPPLSKREKKRTAIERSLKDIATNFAQNREQNMRAQLNIIGRDIVAITNADPYANKGLDDSVLDFLVEYPVFANPSYAHDGVMRRADGTVSVPLEANEGRQTHTLGKYAAQFVDRVNDAMELRDASITEVHMRYEAKMAALQREYDFSIEAAEAEHKALKDSLRDRSIALVKAKKKELQKEKDRLDLADSNTLLHQTSTFTITHPASPGGSHNNRKTRHTRHRLEVPDVDAEGSGTGKGRKRKADYDDSPAPPHSRATHDRDGGILWDKLEHDLAATPSMSIDKLFSVKDLAAHTKMAVESVASRWATKRMRAARAPANGSSQVLLPSANGHISDPLTAEKSPLLLDIHANEDHDSTLDDPSDGPALAAPLMERGGSYATRSSRHNLNLSPHVHGVDDQGGDASCSGGGGGGGGEGVLNDPERIFGFAVIEAVNLRARAKEEVGMTTGLSNAEIQEDLAFFGGDD